MIMELLAAMHEEHYIVNLLLNPLFLWFYKYSILLYPQAW